MAMKKILLTAAVMMATVSAVAQTNSIDRRHELAISGGVLSNSQWIDVFEEVAASMFGARFDKERYIGPVSAEYFYDAKNWLGVGGIFVYGRNTQDIIHSDAESGKLIHNYYTLMPAVKFNWFRRKSIGLYSKLGAGATLRRERIDDKGVEDEGPESNVHFNWQASLVGFEAGSPTFRGFIEIGEGEQGIALVGLRCRF